MALDVWSVLEVHRGIYKEGRKETFYLTTHSTHFILRLFGVGHMVKDHSDSERGNPLPPHGLHFPINSKGSFICTIPQTGKHIPRPLWSTGWNEKYFNGSTPWRIDPTTHRTMSEHSYHGATSRSQFTRSKCNEGCDWCRYAQPASMAQWLYHRQMSW